MPFLRFCTLLLAAALCACAGTPASTIEVADSGVVPAVRVVIVQGNQPSETGSGGAVELLATGFKGRATQTLSGSQLPVRFENRTFSGPVELSNDFGFRYLEAAYRLRGVHRETGLGIEGMIGAGYGQLDLTVVSPSQSVTGSFSAGALVTGLGVLWQMRPGTVVEARYVYSEFVSVDISSARRAELVLAQSLHKNLGVRAGYASWRIDRDVSSGSNYILRFSGPALGLDLIF